MKDKPLPCPFCGTIPRFRHIKDCKPDLDDPFWALCCENKRCSVSPQATDEKKAGALQLWNRRAASPISEARISPKDKVPFIARCGNLLFLVDEIEDLDNCGFIVLRGTIIEGHHFNDRGDYSAGDMCSIGPITDNWTRLTVASYKCSDCSYTGPSVEDVLIHKMHAH